jgi:hypothetical protein
MGSGRYLAIPFPYHLTRGSSFLAKLSCGRHESIHFAEKGIILESSEAVFEGSDPMD